MNDMQVDAILRRLDAPATPSPDLIAGLYEDLRPVALAAARQDRSLVGRLVGSLTGSPAAADGRISTVGAAWRPLLVLVALLALLAWIALAGSRQPTPSPAWHPRHVLFGRAIDGVDGYELWTVGVDGANARRLVVGGHEVSRVSPDGTHIVAPMTGSLVFPTILLADGSQPRPLRPDPTLNLGVSAWSHDGTWLAFEAWDEANPDRSGVYLLHPDGTGLRRLTGSGVPGDFSADDRQLLVTRQEGLFIVNVDGSGERKVGVVRPVGYSSAGFMPDGRSIYAAGDGRLWFIDMTTGIATSLEVPGGSLVTPRVAPDGSMFAFTFDATGASSTAIWVMQADGSNAHVLVDDPAANEDFSDWLP